VTFARRPSACRLANCDFSVAQPYSVRFGRYHFFAFVMVILLQNLLGSLSPHGAGGLRLPPFLRFPLLLCGLTWAK
jgi:hypothetical protein